MIAGSHIPRMKVIEVRGVRVAVAVRAIMPTDDAGTRLRISPILVMISQKVSHLFMNIINKTRNYNGLCVTILDTMGLISN